ncbi:MAG TPA: hypothetical protein PKM72_12470, partial [Nitrospirales bacterium]|nr:hypothetical protein [Nitrospirales bacterium]
MNAAEQQVNEVRKLKRSEAHGWLIHLFQVMVVVGLLLPTFALPTVWAEDVPDVIGLSQGAAESAIMGAGLTVGT